MTLDLCMFLSFSGNIERIRLVVHMILKMYLFWVYVDSLSVNLCVSCSFFSQNGRRISTVCRSSNNHEGIESKSVGSLKSLMTESIRRGG